MTTTPLTRNPHHLHAHASQVATEVTPSDVIVISDDESESSSSSTGRHPKSSRSPHTKDSGSRIAPTAIAALPRKATLTNLRAGAFGDPKTWTFGLPESNYYNLEDLWEEVRDHPTMFLQSSEREKTEELREMRGKIDRIDPKIFGVSFLHSSYPPTIHGQPLLVKLKAHPDATDRSVRYTHVEFPILSGEVWFTIRWWKGKDTRFFFDLVDVPSRKLFIPRHDLKDLSIEVEFLSGMTPLITIEEAMRRSRGRELIGGTGEERYEVQGGSRMFFYRTRQGGRRVLVADIYAPHDRNEPALGPRPETFSPFIA